MNFIKNLLATNSVISSGDVNAATSAMSGLANTINTVAMIIFGLLTIGLVGVAIFLAFKMFTASDDTKRKNAKGQMIYAIIGVVVLMVMLILTPGITNAITNALNSGK